MQVMDNWRLNVPIDVFFFDCDSTLSLIEGIDVLAASKGVHHQVQQITNRCMGQTGLSLADYRTRLSLVQPSRKQIEELVAQYNAHIAPGAFEVIQFLHAMNKQVYIISAGIKAAVSGFAMTLGIPDSQVLAVDVYFDESGHYEGFDEQSPLVTAYGKTRAIDSLLKSGERSVLVGDGMSDWEARPAVTRFIGYAGLKAKEWVARHSNFYINNPSLYSVLPLSLTVEEARQLKHPFDTYYEQGMTEIDNSLVLIREHDHV